VLVSGSASGVSVLGLSATVSLTGSEAAHDRLTLNLLAEDDVLDASDLSADLLALTGDGGGGSRRGSSAARARMSSWVATVTTCCWAVPGSTCSTGALGRT
jgi:hypothetical protein